MAPAHRPSGRRPTCVHAHADAGSATELHVRAPDSLPPWCVSSRDARDVQDRSQGPVGAPTPTPPRARAGPGAVVPADHGALVTRQRSAWPSATASAGRAAPPKVQVREARPKPAEPRMDPAEPRMDPARDVPSQTTLVSGRGSAGRGCAEAPAVPWCCLSPAWRSHGRVTDTTPPACAPPCTSTSVMRTSRGVES